MTKLKESLASANIVESMGILLKIRRNHSFTDFYKKFKQPLTQQKVGASIMVSYYGESGIDQGGINRECFFRWVLVL